MKVHRFIGDFDLSKNGATIRVENDELRNQIKNVLKLHINEAVCLCNGLGVEARAKIVAIEKNAVAFEIETAHETETSAVRDVVLCATVLKKENFELVVQKAVEAGVAAIVPVISARTIKQNLNAARMQKIAHEAAEQSGRGSVPAVREIIDFKTLLSTLEKDRAYFMCDGTGAKSLHEILVAKEYPKIGILIGPEGGWTDEELAMARERNIEIVTLGKTTLRGETAAIVASYVGCAL